jgi:hypothetical protein
MTRGRNLIPLRAFVKETYGDKGWQAFLTELSAKTRAVFDGLILEDAWYDRSIDVEATQTLRRLWQAGDPYVVRKLAARTAHHHDRVYMHPLLTHGDPLPLLRRAAAEYREYYQSGALAVIETRPDGIRLQLDDPHSAEVFCTESLPGFLEEIIRLSGRKVAHVRQEACRFHGAEKCEIDVAWA